jgi:hypothetical protein
MEDLPPWKTFKIEKKLGRLVICLVMVALVDSQASVSSIRNAVASLRDGLRANRPVAADTLVYPFDEFQTDLLRAIRTYGRAPAELVQNIAQCLDDVNRDILSKTKVRKVRGTYDFKAWNIVVIVCTNKF